jgi:antitoxin component YwqK of YwqJK toxin-antitoxin module
MWRHWDEHGLLHAEGYMSEGQFQGAYREWDAEGHLRLLGFFENNDMHGVQVRLHGNGALHQVSVYERGVLRGTPYLGDSAGDSGGFRGEATRQGLYRREWSMR